MNSTNGASSSGAYMAASGAFSLITIDTIIYDAAEWIQRCTETFVGVG